MNVADILIDLGIIPGRLSFEYTKRAVEIIIDSNGKLKTCQVYQMVGDEFDVKWNSAERLIRYALLRIDRTSEAFQKYIGIQSVKSGKILYVLAHRIRQERGIKA